MNTKGLTRLADTIQRTYSFVEDDNMASYSYDNPAPDFEGATSRSYTETAYQGMDPDGAWSSLRSIHRSSESATTRRK